MYMGQLVTKVPKLVEGNPFSTGAYLSTLIYFSIEFLAFAFGTQKLFNILFISSQCIETESQNLKRYDAN